MYLKPYFYTRPSLYKFGELFSSSSNKTMSNLSKLANIIFLSVLLEKSQQLYLHYVLYPSLVVCFCFMFSQTQYLYDLSLLRQNYSLYIIIIVCFLYH